MRLNSALIISRNARGFSLIEVMTVVLVLAIILGIGIPSFSALFERSRFETSRESVLSAFSQARVEALTRRQAVEVCRGNGNGCDDGADWSSGLAMVTTGANPEVLHVWDVAKGASVQLSSGTRVRYQSDGGAADKEVITVSYGDRSTVLELLLTGAIVEQPASNG